MTEEKAVSDGEVPYRYWYSAEQHKLLQRMAREGVENCNVGQLEGGSIYTECHRAERPSGAWPDYVLVGESERWKAILRPADRIPIQGERP